MFDYTEKISELSRVRLALYNKDENDKQVDELAITILDFIKKGFGFLKFEFIFEELSKLGQCPNLLNDDNGHWAVTCDGFQSIPEDLDKPSDIETQFWVKANQWKDTPREALQSYLTDYDE